MHITRKILIFDGQCNYEKCLELTKKQLLCIHVYDFRKFSPYFIKFTVDELKVARFLKPFGFLKQTEIRDLKSLDEQVYKIENTFGKLNI